MSEIYKSMSQVNPEFIWSYLTNKEFPCNLRKRSILNLKESVLRVMIQIILLLLLNPDSHKVNLKKNHRNIDYECLICQ